MVLNHYQVSTSLIKAELYGHDLLGLDLSTEVATEIDKATSSTADDNESETQSSSESVVCDSSCCNGSKISQPTCGSLLKKKLRKFMALEESDHFLLPGINLFHGYIFAILL